MENYLEVVLDHLQFSQQNADDTVFISLKTFNGLVQTIYLL